MKVALRRWWWALISCLNSITDLTQWNSSIWTQNKVKTIIAPSQEVLLKNASNMRRKRHLISYFGTCSFFKSSNFPWNVIHTPDVDQSLSIFQCHIGKKSTYLRLALVLIVTLILCILWWVMQWSLTEEMIRPSRFICTQVWKGNQYWYHYRWSAIITLLSTTNHVAYF